MNDYPTRADAAAAGRSDWHTLAAQEVVALQASDPQRGLSDAAAAQRVLRYGPNALRTAAARRWPAILVSQFTDFMIIVLMAAAVVAGLVGEAEDVAVIVAIVILNGVIGFVQEWRAENALAALRRMAAAGATVVRDGEPQAIEASLLVPGDLVLLEAGQIVPADLRLLEVGALRIDESALTGESVAADKDTLPVPVAAAPLGERHCLAYRGTVVVHGRGAGIVVATGMACELGRIASMLAEEAQPKSPLQLRLARFGRQLSIAVLVICVALFALGIVRGEPPLLMLLTSISLAVAAIPEALPAVVTIVLALGARGMVARHVLVRRLAAVETLGSVSVICSDKTGTLTRNRMAVEQVFVDGGRHAHAQADAALATAHGRALAEAMVLCNDAAVTRSGHGHGEPTEAALLEAALRTGVGVEDLRNRHPRAAEWPFDSERKRMTTLHVAGDVFVAITKGAPETVIPLCTGIAAGAIAHPGAARPIDRAALLHVADAMAADGLRVLAIARRGWIAPPAGGAPERVEHGLELIGLVGLLDPPRAEAAHAVAQCVSAGITPVMITGDHPATALAIARRLGIARDGGDAAVLTGVELAALSDEALHARAQTVRVYARVDPAHKIRIVKALQAQGRFVAMTGDGVNDAPALRRADIGVAMGKGGTDVAREASSLVLLDDNFASIVAAVREGRRIYDNIRKFVKYAMTGNSAEILTIALAPLFGLPIPLLPIHILWVNLVTDGLPGIALAGEAAEHDLMRRPPRPAGESLFAQGMWQHIVAIGAVMAGLCLALTAQALAAGIDAWQTMVFSALTFAQLAHVLAVRSERASVLTLRGPGNPALLATVALTVALQLAVVYLPALQTVFRTQALSAVELGACAAVGVAVFVLVEIEKSMIRRGWLYSNRRATGVIR